MKNICAILGLLSLVLFSSSSLLAVRPIKNTPIKQENTSELTDKQAKKLDKFEKRIAKKMEKMKAKSSADVDFNDPVDKWMWFWIFAWGLGLAAFLVASIALSGFFGFVGSALMVFGFIALVLWLVKKFS